MEGFGLDRVSVSFPVREWEQDRTAWSSMTHSGAGDRAWSARAVGGDGSSVFAGVMDAGGAPGPWGKLEFNPAKLTGEYPGPASVDSLRAVAREAYDQAAGLLVPAIPLDEWRVRRLDLARDFRGVGRPDAYVRGLQGAHRPWARRSFVYNDPARARAETLFVGSGAGGCRLYDKHAENVQVEAGTVRWEAECRRDWLSRYAGIETVSDVTAGKVARLGRDRWEWSAMGTEVTGGRSLVAKVQASGLTPAQGRAFLGWLVESAAGGSSSCSTRTTAKYRKLARTLGIAVSVEAWADTAVVGRLDYDQGGEVLTLVA